eukprot:2577378-Alexandrium_andersonii.AAC.1
MGGSWPTWGTRCLGEEIAWSVLLRGTCSGSATSWPSPTESSSRPTPPGSLSARRAPGRPSPRPSC